MSAPDGVDVGMGSPMRTAFVLLAVLATAACPPPGLDEADGGQLLEFDDAGIPERPAPLPDAGVVECIELLPVPDERLPRCTAATRDCVAACPAEGGDACRDACWLGDPTPADGDMNCQGCIFAQLLACLDGNGCHSQTQAYYCCLIEACATGTPGCDQQCADDANAMFTCGFVEAPACFDVVGGDVGRCYAAEDPVEETDAGPDAGPDAEPDAGDVVDGGP